MYGRWEQHDIHANKKALIFLLVKLYALSSTSRANQPRTKAIEAWPHSFECHK